MARPRLEDGALTQTTFRLTETDLSRIREAAQRDERSPSNWIRVAIKEKLEREQNGTV